MGGRGSSGGNNPGSGKATTESKAVKQKLAVTESEISKVTFKQDKSANRYVASTGTVTYPDGETSNKAVEMVVMRGRDKGKDYYTTRFIVKHVGADWQYNTTKYSSLNAAKAGVKTDVKEYLEDLKKERRR